MRLLNATSMRLELFLGAEIPPYAILSHTWGEEEILFGDIFDDCQALPTHKKGW